MKRREFLKGMSGLLLAMNMPLAIYNPKTNSTDWWGRESQIISLLERKRIKYERDMLNYLEGTFQPSKPDLIICDKNIYYEWRNLTQSITIKPALS